MSYRNLLILSLLTLVSFSSLAQYRMDDLSTKSKKAKEYYADAEKNLARRNYREAMRLYSEAINKDKKFVEAHIQLGVCYRVLNDRDNAEINWTNAYDAAKQLKLEDKYPDIPYFLGDISLERGEYEKAASELEVASKSMRLDPRRKRKAYLLLAKAEYALQNMKNPLDFNPVPVTGIVNRFPMQYFPVLTADQNQLFFTRRLGFNYNDDEDIHVSVKDDEGKWTKSVSVSDKINTKYNEGTCSISADGRTLIFTSCEGRSSFGSCDLFISYLNGDDWSEPVNLGSAINTQYWESQPSLSADGKTLFFVSDRPGGIGKRDIYVSKNKDGAWLKPTNLGKGINTPEDEVSPFIHVNNQNLYFASEGLLGFGSFDLYVTELDNGSWGEPVNLGYPLNDYNEQTSLFITADGNKGYYSNQNKGNRPTSYIYEFGIPEEIKVENKSTYVRGKVFDAESQLPLAASIELYDLNTEQKIYDYRSDSVTGDYLMVLTEGSDYALYTSREGYLFKSEYFSYQENKIKLEPINVDIPLDPIKPGVSTRLNNIFFETNEYTLTDRSKVELSKVVSFMSTNDAVRVEIEGHTDNQGGKDYNQELSEKRAESVYYYLVEQGVNMDRISFIGYGDSKPVASNDNEEGRSLNRRIDFKIID